MTESTMNAPIITQTTASQIVKNMIERGNTRPIMFFGKGGIGKTEAIANIAMELNIGYVDIRLLLYTESDLKGIPFINAENTATIWLQNNVLPNVERDGERGILVFDEITSCSKSVRTAAYQLLNERKLGEYSLPEGWSMVCLGNGENDGGNFNGMEANFANRCSVYEIVPSLESWKEWALKNDVNPFVIGYVSWKHEHLHTLDADKDGEIVFASPRSWKAVSDILNHTPFEKNDQVLYAEILANVGNLVGGLFWGFCEYKDSIIEPTEILAGTATTIPDEPEVLYMTLQSLVRLMGDNINACKNQDGNVKTVKPEVLEQCVNGIKWILKLRSLEQRTMGIKDLISIDPVVMRSIILSPKFLKSCPELLKFTEENELVFRK